MPRQPRFNLIDVPQHVIIRGNNRIPIFHQDKDYHFFLKKLSDACIKHSCRVHAYVLMTNHVHLLISPSSQGAIGKVMQMVGRYYVQYFNRCYSRSGTLWEGRYRASLVDSEHYALLCYRYIELNPVRAGMVDSPSQYPWSSYRCNALGHINSLVTPHDVYINLGVNESHRQQAYRGLFAGHIKGDELFEIREMVNKGWVLGSSDFKNRVAQQVKRPVSPSPRGGIAQTKA